MQIARFPDDGSGTGNFGRAGNGCPAGAFGASAAADDDDRSAADCPGPAADDLYWTAPNGPAWRPRSERPDAKTDAGEWAGERSETDGEPATHSSKRKSRRKGGVEGGCGSHRQPRRRQWSKFLFAGT